MSAFERDAEGRVLIIFPGALGDLICLIPTIRAIIADNPRASVELMARMELARFAVGRIGVARAHSIDRAEVSQLFVAGDAYSEAARSFFGGFARVYSFFAADDERFRSALTAVTRDVRFYPFRPPGEGHVAVAYLRAMRLPHAIAAEVTLDLSDDDHAVASKIFIRCGLEPHSYLLVLPGSGSRSKNWPAEKFGELAERITVRATPLVVLGPAEEGLDEIFCTRGIATLRGLELGAVAALARQAKAFIGNDSGVSHLAAAAGARGVVLFGPTDPARWRPLGRVEVIRYQPISDLLVAEVETALTGLLCSN
ncbi:MAG TPA: glycosyltransferase family 9 protein [Candidatus Binataceae bacterium]|nr:glycosyltransferase family 9 protein [Candidatus Binataceae bacterium]